ncbi:MAG: Fe-S cluster assembly protein SufD [Gammaproteobacteria bacterium]|nr:MAG: Fe-S cluster assembly protein SufD [Gammaproteobacteria bacterium]
MNTEISPLEYARSLQALGAHERQRLPDWMQTLRAQGQKALTQAQIPDRKLESWRYAGAQRLFRSYFEPAAPLTAADEHAATAAAEWYTAGEGVLRIALVDGHLHLSPETLARLPEGASVRPLTALTEGASPLPGELVPPGRDLFAAMSAAGIGLGFLLELADDVQLSNPVEVVYLWRGGEGPRLLQPRCLLVLGRNASATLLEQHLGLEGAACFSNVVSEIWLGEGAHLTHLQYQGQNAASQHLCVEALRLATGSRYEGTRFALGGAWARNEIEIDFAGEGAAVDLAGLFTVGKGQLNDIQTRVRHAVPGCHSEVRFKSILHGAGRGVMDGQIAVARDAQRSEAHLQSANLMLARDAEIDARPTLEILADDVQCSHGASVGQLDPLQLYYLRSRGIDTVTATRLLAMGFAREILQRNPYPILTGRIEQRLADALVAAAAQEVNADG